MTWYPLKRAVRAELISFTLAALHQGCLKAPQP